MVGYAQDIEIYIYGVGAWQVWPYDEGDVLASQHEADVGEGFHSSVLPARNDFINNNSWN